MRGLVALASAPADTQRISEWDIPWNRSVLQGSSGINEITAFNLSAVWASETLITDAIATLPVDTYRKTETGREATSPPGWVENPNPDMGRIDYDTQRLLSLLGWGNAYSLLVRKDGSKDPRSPVTQRWIADPWRCRLFRDPKTGTKLLDVNGKSYLPAQYQHVPGYVRPGELAGMSVIENARRSLGLGSSAEKFGEAFYDNGVTSQVSIEMPQMPADVQPAVVEQIRETVAAKYAGGANAYKPLLLMGGTTAKTLSISPTDAQFLETRKFQVTEIARWFRVPPHMIGDVEKSTSWGTGIEQQTLGFAKFTLQPWIARLEAADSALLTRPQFIRFNMNAFLRADLLTRYRAYAMGRAAGILSADEPREWEDLAPIPDDGGKVFLQPLNMIDVLKADEALAQSDPGLNAGAE